MTTTGIALAGAGRVAQLHLDAIAAVDGARLVAVADPDIEAASTLVEGETAVTVTPDLSTTLRRSDVDAVIIAAPTQLHYQLALDAIRAGKHVLVEKPFTSTLKQARDLIAAAGAEDVLVAAGQVMRFMPMFSWASRFIAEGAFGEPIQVIERRLTDRREAFAWWRDLPYFLIGHWGSHSIDLVHHLTGRQPEQVFCVGGSYVPGVGSTDDCTIVMTMGQGGRLTSHLSFSAHQDVHDIVMIGTKATLVFDCYRSVSVDGTEAMRMSPGEMLAQGFRDQLSDFLRGTESRTCVADARTVLPSMAAIAAAELSVRTQAAVAVEEVFR